ncbi:MAG: alpha/beta hydrolase [Pseudomonadaceae bacterium]|nr:alpha/beta hydrolase [Pseudomonadaceae bacterium]
MKLDTSRIDSELAPLVSILPEGLKLITRETLQSIRDGEIAAAPEKKPTDVVIEERHIPGVDGDVRVLIHTPPADGLRPAVLWIHGGGYIMGSAEDDRARLIAEETGAVVVSVDYRLAPEHPFPAGPEDCYSSLKWLFANAQSLGIDSARVAIGGASAGAGMAAGVVLMNRDRDNLPLAFQLLLYPMIDNLHATASGEIEDHPVWSRPTSFNAWEMYLDGTPGLDASPYAAAARATNLAGLPPAYICVGSEDLFRDEDIDYARRLSEANVATELAVLPGMIHGGDIFAPHAKISVRLRRGFLAALADALA